MHAVIDRLESGKAVLVDEKEQEAVIPQSWIAHAREGMALEIEITEDPEGEETARKEAQELLKGLKHRQ